MLSLLLLSAQLIAQNRTISGRITDDKGSGVPNASVVIRGTTQGTTTSSDGNFTLTVPSSARALMVSSVGLGEKEVTLTPADTYNIVLSSKAVDLQEVVVVGYQQRRRRDEAGAISTIKAGEIENLPTSSIDRLLQGRAAGVVVQANNGIPGGAVTVRVRGYGSINAGNTPLYIVDGVQLNTANTTTFTQSNPLSFLNPNDIETIDILKDAASAAIYGAAASNGVVIITTKKGRAGKTKINFETYYGQTSPLKYLDVVNTQEYFQLRTEATGNFNNLPANDLAVKRSVLVNDFRLPSATVNTWDNKTIDSFISVSPTYDWQRAAFRNGNIQNYELGISGGNERTTFRISGNYNNQQAVITKADFKRYGLNFNLVNKATDKLTVTTGLNLSTFSQQGPFGGGDANSSLGNISFAASGILPYNPIYNPDGTYYGLPGQTPANLAGVLSQNPVAVNDLNKISQRTNQMVGNIQGEYKLFEWLSFRSFYSLDYRNVIGNSYWDPRTPDGFNRGGLGQTFTNWNTNFLTTQMLSARHEFGGKHRLDGILGYEYRKEDFSSTSASGDGFPTPQFTTLGTAANPVSVFQSTSQFRRQGAFANANYSFDGKYIFGVTGRYDGSSRFGANTRYGFFPGVKVGWNIDREKFMENSKVLSSLRLRASYGANGNDQIANLGALGLYSGGVNYGGRAGIQYTQLSNPELSWEANNTLNLGLDFGFINNRINGSVEVYDRRTSELLLDQQVSLTTGFNSVRSNVGKVQNRGVELTLNVNPIRSISGGFNWNSTFTFAYNKSKLLELYSGAKDLGTAYRVGQPLFLVQTAPYAGVSPATGRPMWYDSLGNLTYQIVSPKDLRIIGDELPEFTGGLNNTFSYKGLTLDVFFMYEYGRLVNDGQINFLSEASGRINWLQDIYDKRWTTPGQVTSVPRMNLAAEQKSSGVQAGSRMWYNGDFIRLKNILLSYDLPNNLTRRLKITNARFYVQATNLATFSDLASYDPEFLGAGTGQIPQSRNFTVGLQLGL